ncbi:MAG: tetratricopeptide repeat protein [Thermomicrobiales bacterium]
MTVPPSGIVTFLLTDIEGSTRLWEQNRPAMARAAARHDALLEQAITDHDGVLFKHVGDAVQAAFASPVEAVAAAVAAQRAIAAEPWPETGPLRVRMGIHRGEAAPNEHGDYHQVPCLNRAHRLMSAGHGGQVLVSQTVREATGASLPPGVTTRELGRHRLRDLLEPEHISQLVIAGLPEIFPPLKTLEGYANNLPTLVTALIGRESELAALGGLLQDGGPRLITLVGPGGVGKTHLALQAAADAADHFADGVWLVRLGEVHAAEQIVPAIAATLGVREGGGLTTEEALLHWIGARRVLFVLDNLEQIAGAGRTIAALLAATPQARIIATSRQRLRAGGERVFPVAPLSLPAADEAANIRSSPAVNLFLERAEATAPGGVAIERDAALVAAICVRLDGLPLAIELAAAQLRTRTLAELLRDLEERFDLLSGGRPEGLSHQQSLAATIAWSYDRLEPEAQRLLRCCAVFANGWSREAVEAVYGGNGGRGEGGKGGEGEWGKAERRYESLGGETPAQSRDFPLTPFPPIPPIPPIPPSPPSPSDLLASLVEHSLVQRSATGDDSRWSLLESIRAFARERLEETGESESAHQRHAAWCLAFAEGAVPRIDGAEQLDWLGRLDREHDNARVALRWYEAASNGVGALALAVALAPYWQTRGFFSEGRRWLERASGLVAASSDLAARAAREAGALALAQGDFPSAQRWFSDALAAARAQDDREAESVVLANLGAIALECGNLDEAERYLNESLAIAAARQDQRRQGDILANLGAVAHYQGNAEQALRRYLESLRIWRDLGDSRGIADMRLNVLLLLAPRSGACDQARAAGEEALRHFRDLGDPQGEALALAGLGLVAATAGNLDRAAELQEESLRLARRLEDPATEARVLGNLVAVELDRKRFERAESLLRDYFPLVEAVGYLDGLATGFEVAAALHTAFERWDQAAQLTGAAAALRERIATPTPPEGQVRHAAVVASLQHHLADRYDAIVAEGAALSVVDAVATALRRDPPPAIDDPLAALLLTLDETFTARTM